MAGTQGVQLSRRKSIGELGWEAARFLLHTCAALAIVVVIMLGGMAMHLDPDAASPKIIATALIAVLAVLCGFAVMEARQDQAARYTWVSAVLLFSMVCVWVLDLPTGHGLCEHCDAVDKLTRTFFSLRNGSGLAGGWGLVLGAWSPLVLLCYALGAQLGWDRSSDSERNVES